MKIGLYGGTFNPVHIGHLIVSREVKELLNLDKLLFIPSFLTPLKNNQTIIDWQYRMKMLSLIEDPFFEISDFEIKQKRTVYTYETTAYFKNKFPDDDIYFIIGYDSYLNFTNWKNWQKILSDVKIVVTKRNNTVDNIINRNDKKIMDKFIFLNNSQVDISSSIIRERIKKDKSISFLVPPDVQRFILTEKLYQ